ncbi:MAG: hypothetical protein ACRDPY_37200 [Streptosporangiaceae bacterium]
MASVIVSFVSCLMALVTSSLVSRTAALASTAASHAKIASRTWVRASAAAAGPAVSRTREICSSEGRVGAIVFIGFLRGPGFKLARQGVGHPARLPPGRSEHQNAVLIAGCKKNAAASCSERHRSADVF